MRYQHSAFANHAPVLKVVPIKVGKHNVSKAMNMSTPAFSRRRLGQIALGASAVGACAALGPTLAMAAGAAKAPKFVRGEGGISFYDIKTGAGSAPLEDDFVVIDYVR